MSLKNIDLSNSKVSTESFDIKDLKVESPRSLAYTVSWQLAKRRTGSASTKIMSEISGTTAKPHKQKGTGMARQGSKRSVQFRGGRTCFGPRPRSFEYSLPKKIVKKAVADVIKLKIQENKLILFSGAKENLKTSQINKILKDNKIDSALFLYGAEADLSKSVRNIKNVKALDFKGLNVYDVLNFDFLMLDKNLFSNIKEVVA